MNYRKWIIENTTMLSLLMIAFGFIMILLAHNLDISIWRSLLESLGILFTTIFFISLLYEILLAEKYRSEFDSMITKKLKEMDNIQSMCSRLGIREILRSRVEFESKHPLLDIFSRTKKNSRVFVIGRSMYHFFNRLDAIKMALERGIIVQIACLSPAEMDDVLAEVCFLRQPDIQASLQQLGDLIEWIKEEKPSGSFELRIHKARLPDSILYAELENENILAWDMTFGRDLNQKRVFIIEPHEGNIGNDLLHRYDTIWGLAEVYVKFKPDGEIEVNDLERLTRE